MRIAVALLLMSFAAASAQPNLLVNPGFDEDLDGWASLFGRPAAWDAEDLLAAPDSGSARTGNEDVGNGAYGQVLVQCVPITAVGYYRFGAWIRNPAGQPVAGSGALMLQQFHDASCTNLITSHFTGPASSTAWTWREAFADVFTNAQSLRLSLLVGKPSGATELHEMLFDDIELVSYDTLFADGFDEGE